MALLYLGAVSWAPASACQVGVRTPHLPPTMHVRMSAGAEADAAYRGHVAEAYSWGSSRNFTLGHADGETKGYPLR